MSQIQATLASVTQDAETDVWDNNIQKLCASALCLFMNYAASAYCYVTISLLLSTIGAFRQRPSEQNKKCVT